MPHPLIMQLRFTHSEFTRGLEGLSETNAGRRFLPMNCISWNIGHMAWQEQRYWLTRLQGQIPLPQLNDLVGYGPPTCTPALANMWEAWQTVTRLADPFLDTLTTRQPQEIHVLDDGQTDYTAGTLLQRVIYHYWYHTGENLALRQLLGHSDLPEFVGNIDDEAPTVLRLCRDPTDHGWHKPALHLSRACSRRDRRRREHATRLTFVCERRAELRGIMPSPRAPRRATQGESTHG